MGGNVVTSVAEFVGVGGCAGDCVVGGLEEGFYCVVHVCVAHCGLCL